MGLIIDFPGAAGWNHRVQRGQDEGVVATTPFVSLRERDVSTSPYTFDRERYRAAIEYAAQTCLDMAHRFVELLDRIDGDPDFEPSGDDKENGDAEPALAALIGLDSQARWTGFEGGAA